MFDVKNKMCIKCKKKQPIFGINDKATHCFDCKDPGMVDIRHDKCQKCNKTRPSFGLEKDIATHCVACKTEKMFNVIDKMCEKCNNTIPTFGLEYGKATHCVGCKDPDMFDVRHQMCEICNITRPVFGLVKGIATRCTTCKTDEMFNVIDKMCQVCDETLPSFGLEYGKSATHCIKCKSVKMFDVRSKQCLSDFCYSRSYSTYDNYCKHCYVNLFPNKPLSKAYMRKETEVTKYIKENLAHLDFIYDKIIDNGCSKRRPDIFLDLLSHVVIGEIDENQHNGYDEICENRRIMEISQDLAHRPVIFIRLNPDDYTINNVNIVSPWKRNVFGGISLKESSKHEWNLRLEHFAKRLIYWTEHVPDKIITTEHLFFDQ
jgi:hypothetical protein